VPELPAARTRTSLTIDNEDGSFTTISSQATLHYESILDSGTFDAILDCTPERVDNAQLDGWRATYAGFHYALGQPAGKADGWIGYGGRQGAHWLQMRLTRVGYLHWPTRAWDDIGGSPAYDRAHLSYESDTRLNRCLESRATWENIWTTPGGGALSMAWTINGDRLKGSLTINQDGRAWIQANRPPTTPVTETWFGYVFLLDISDIPQVIRDGIDPGDDFADDGLPIELRDHLDRVLGIIPLDYAYVVTGDAGGEQDQVTIPLRKRIWRIGPDWYLLVGARCDELAGLPEGTLIFDPTVTPRVSAGDDNCYRKSSVSLYSDPSGALFFGEGASNEYDIGLRWTLNVPAGASIDSAKVTFTSVTSNSGTTMNIDIAYEDGNDPGDFGSDSEADFLARTRSSTTVDWDSVEAFTSEDEHDSPDISTLIQALVNESYWATGEHVVLFFDNDASSSASAYRKPYSFTAGSAKAALLTVEYTAANVPAAWYHYRHH
jgi:hypothetical protein